MNKDMNIDFVQKQHTFGEEQYEEEEGGVSPEIRSKTHLVRLTEY